MSVHSCLIDPCHATLDNIGLIVPLPLQGARDPFVVYIQNHNLVLFPEPTELTPEPTNVQPIQKWNDGKRGKMADRPLPVPAHKEAYYMSVDRSEAEAMLAGQPDGTFILRPSSQVRCLPPVGW